MDKVELRLMMAVVSTVLIIANSYTFPEIALDKSAKTQVPASCLE